MATITIEDYKPTAIEATIDVVSTVGGVVLAACGGYYLNRFLPVATTAVEEVVRNTSIGLGGTVIATAGKKALKDEMTEIHTQLIVSRLQAKGLLDAQEVAEINEVVEKENKTKANQATARKK